jgi:hypothetical protein
MQVEAHTVEGGKDGQPKVIGQGHILHQLVEKGLTRVKSELLGCLKRLLQTLRSLGRAQVDGAVV